MNTKRISALALALMIGIATWASEQHRNTNETVVDQPAALPEVAPAVELLTFADC